jgi:molecular chaperone DnaK (HSP70)
MLKLHSLNKICLLTEQVDIPKLSLFIESGKFEEDFEIIVSKMDETSMKTIKKLTIDSIKNSDKFYTICKNLSKSLMKQFGGEWQCFAHKKCFGNFNIIQKTVKYILFNFADLTFLIFQTQ